MNILFVTDAARPFSGSGAAAQVCQALPKALKPLEHQPYVLSPLYKSIKPEEHALARRLTKLAFSFGGQDWKCEQWNGRTIGGTEHIFIGNEQLFHSVDGIAEGSELDVANRVGAFVRSAITLLEKDDQNWTVIHGHGWLGAAVIAAAKAAGLPHRTVLTVHETSQAQTFAAKHAERLGFGAGSGPIDPLRSGLAVADEVTVASAGMDLGAFYEGTTRLIASGLDASIWNPLTDPALPARFDPVELDGKVMCKAEFQNELGLPERMDVPLMLVVGSDDGQDGLDLIAKCASELLRNDVQLAVMAPANGKSKTLFEELSSRWPDRCQVSDETDDRAIHCAYAAADLVLIPAPEAANAIGAKVAQRYGALPIARRAGAMNDAIVDCDAKLETGTGLLFDDATSESVLGAAQRGLAAYAAGTGDGEAFDVLQRRLMKLDLSWERSARLFERLYATPPVPS